MLETQEIVNFLNNKLNEIGTDSDYSFNLMAEVGENTNDDKIKGIVKTSDGQLIPVENIKKVDYTYNVEFLVPASKTNYNITNIDHIVETMINTYNGTKQDFENGSGTITFSLDKPSQYQVAYGIGESIPLGFMCKVVYSENVVLSKDKKWFLDGIEIPYNSESVLIEKDGRTNSINGDNFKKSILTAQARYYKFTIPFTTDNEVCTTIQKDLLSGNFEKVYELKYFDGVSFTEEEPFITNVSIFRNADTSSQAPEHSSFNITFTDVDNNQTEYFIALIDNPFDNQTENTRFFDTEQEQIDYYNNKVLQGADYEPIKAPNLNSIDITSQVYRNTHNYDLFDITNKNYAIIKVVGEETKYFYYFVTNSQIGSANQVLFDLRLDTIQTYFFKEDINFSDCFIEKANLNRFVDNNDGTVSFNGGVDSDLFEREEVQNVAKRLTARTKISIYNSIDNQEIADWLEDNVFAWCYLFLDSTHKYSSIVNFNGISTTFPMNFTPLKIYPYLESSVGGIPTAIDTTVACLCFPIMKTQNAYRKIYIDFDSTHSYEWSENGLVEFLKNNNDYSFVYQKKISFVPPFMQETTGRMILNGSIQTDGLHLSDYVVDEDNVKLNGLYDSFFFTKVNLQDSSNTYVIENLKLQNVLNLCDSYTLGVDFKFQKSQIIGAVKNSVFNPKLLNSDYKTIKITTNDGNSFDYDLQKLNKPEVVIQYAEPFTADITRYFASIKNVDGIYIPETTKNFTGLVGSVDNSMAMSNDKFQEMLASTKNFYNQSNFNLLKTGLSGAAAMAGGFVMGNPMAVGAAGIATVNSLLSTIVQRNMTEDNMKNAPDTLKNVGGNVFLNFGCTEMGLYLEEYDILPNEKEIVNDVMVKYGFTYNKFGNIRDFTKIRKYFNYIKAQIDNISGISMSNIARADMRQRFANGVRFWNSDNVDYSMENYEKWLED